MMGAPCARDESKPRLMNPCVVKMHALRTARVSTGLGAECPLPARLQAGRLPRGRLPAAARRLQRRRRAPPPPLRPHPTPAARRAAPPGRRHQNAAVAVDAEPRAKLDLQRRTGGDQAGRAAGPGRGRAEWQLEGWGRRGGSGKRGRARACGTSMMIAQSQSACPAPTPLRPRPAPPRPAPPRPAPPRPAPPRPAPGRRHGHDVPRHRRRHQHRGRPSHGQRPAVPGATGPAHLTGPCCLCLRVCAIQAQACLLNVCRMPCVACVVPTCMLWLCGGVVSVLLDDYNTSKKCTSTRSDGPPGPC
jgi:hypothetical protein